MTSEQWTALILRVFDDIRQNRAPPASVNKDSLADTLEHVAASLPAIILTLRAHQGVLTGAADILAALAKVGVPHAAEIESAVLAIPGVLESADKYIPIVAGVINEFKPAPIGITGGWSGARGHV